MDIGIFLWAGAGMLLELAASENKVGEVVDYRVHCLFSGHCL